VTTALWDSAPLLAVGAAIGFAASGIALKRALRCASPLAAALVSVTFTTVFIWALIAATVPPALVARREVLPFVVAGLAAPGLARLVMFAGIDRVGVSRSSALVSTAPLFAILMAMVVLGEQPSGALVAGAAAVMAGGALLSLRHREERAWRRRDLALPVLAAVGFALRDTVSRLGLVGFPYPLVAAGVATLASLAVMAAIGAVQRGTGRVRLELPALPLLLVAGACEGAAYLVMWRALTVGAVSLVSPLVHTQPIFTIALAAVFLRDLERVTWRLVVAATLILAGVAFVLQGRAA
jgi:drug/metabolite transporter (DMT)-like permease